MRSRVGVSGAFREDGSQAGKGKRCGGKNDDELGKAISYGLKSFEKQVEGDVGS